LRLSAAPHNSRPQEDKVGRASDALQNTMKMSGRGDSVWTQARLRLVDAFRVMDKDGSGTISREELHHTLVNIGMKPAEIEALWQAADVDGDGKLAFRDFSAMFGRASLQSVAAQKNEGNRQSDPPPPRTPVRMSRLGEFNHPIVHASVTAVAEPTLASEELRSGSEKELETELESIMSIARTVLSQQLSPDAMQNATVSLGVLFDDAAVKFGTTATSSAHCEYLNSMTI
jgi:hypothetical protein